MMTIFGKPRARAGQILYEGRDITEVPTHEIARLRIAQSPEGRRIFPRMTVAENLQMGAAATDSSEAERAAGLDRVLTLVRRLKERVPPRGGTLSGGEQPMLARGRHLATPSGQIHPTMEGTFSRPACRVLPVAIEEDCA